MSRLVTMAVPDEVYERAEEAARVGGIGVEDALLDSLRSYWLADAGLESDAEKLALIAAGIDATDWWDAPGDREWDRWQP